VGPRTGYTAEGILPGIPTPATPLTAPASGPTGPLPRAERQAAILQGAAAAFVGRGYAATSMEEIAAASGITKLIVYRHFESKEALYRAVLQRVFDRLAEEFLTLYASRTDAGGFGARSMLRVAREDPAGFELLWRHAAREPQFAEYANELRDHAVDASRALLGPLVDPTLREWAAQTVVGYLVEATLNWLSFGDPARDDEFVELATEAIRVAVGSWGRTAR
jgi:AcrR family transcriptional regulator